MGSIENPPSNSFFLLLRSFCRNRYLVQELLYIAEQPHDGRCGYNVNVVTTTIIGDIIVKYICVSNRSALPCPTLAPRPYSGT